MCLLTQGGTDGPWAIAPEQARSSWPAVHQGVEGVEKRLFASSASARDRKSRYAKNGSISAAVGGASSLRYCA